MPDRYDEYFEEVDAKKRKKILKSLQDEPVDEETLAQIRTLYDLRYKADKKGRYVDLFLRVLVSLRALVGVRPSRFSTPRSTNHVLDNIHTLCLDRTDEFSRDILYREMCNLISLYISLCYSNSRYRSGMLGLSKMSDDRLETKIRADLNELWGEIPKYVEVTADHLILRRAMDDMMDQKLVTDEHEDEEE